jgi:uncharacterized repeat protein (TIGR03847 family)
VSDSFDFDPVDWVTAGAIGEPGRRIFYVQARRGTELVALVVEKAQVAALAQLAQDLLGQVGVTVLPDDLNEAAMRLVEPVLESWRAGTMSLGMDTDGTRFLLEAEELTDDDDDEEDGASARFWMTREQVVALAAYAAYAVEAGARDRCRFCGRPIEPEDGHVCPAMNGHGRLTV